MKTIFIFLLFTLSHAQWTYLSELSPAKQDMTPQAHLTGRRDAAIFFLNSELYVFGGHGEAGLLSDFWKYEMETGRWLWMPDVPQTLSARSGAAYWVFNERLWLFGGKNAEGKSLRELWQYEPTKRKWSLLAMPSHMPAERHAAAFWLQPERSRLFIYGGRDNVANVTHEDMWSLDLNTLQWAAVNQGGDMPGPREGAKAILGPGRDTVYLFGGYNENHLLVSRLKQLDLTTNIWSESINKNHESTPRSRDGHALWLSPDQDSVFVYGGKSNTQIHNDLWSYGIDAQQWEQISKGGPSARWGVSQFVGPRGGIYIFGGVLDSKFYLNDLWKYGPLNYADTLSAIKFQLDATTIGALLAGSMSTIAVALLLFAFIIFLFLRCRRGNFEKIPMALQSEEVV